MKKIKITLTEEMKSEGITEGVIDFIQEIPKIPALLKNGSGTAAMQVTFLRASEKQHWAYFNGSIIETIEKGKKVASLFTNEECIIAKARYFIVNREQLISDEIDKEVLIIKDSLKKEVNAIIANFDRLHLKAFGECKYQSNQNNDLLKAVFEAHGTKHPEIEKFFADNPNYIKQVDALHNSLKEEDYDSLYMILKSDCLPLIFTGKIDNSKDMAVLKEHFSSGEIEKTIDDMAGKSHIHNVAKFKIEKQYCII